MASLAEWAPSTTRDAATSAASASPNASANARTRRGWAPLAQRSSSGSTAAACMAWPDTPVKFQRALPTPQPMKAILLAVVKPKARPNSVSQTAAARRSPVIASQPPSASAVGSASCASPRRVTTNQNSQGRWKPFATSISRGHRQ